MIQHQKKPRVALVHDYLREYGGAERVLEALHEIYPDAPVFVAFFDKEALGIHAERFADWDIRQTWITNLPFYKKLFSPYRIFAKAAFESLDLSEYDLVISSSNAYMAKAVKTKKGSHYCYCHTPPRSLYGYTTMTDWKKNPAIRMLGHLINHFMRIWDFEVAQRVDHFIANSQETKKRINKFYRKDSVVIYPPVDLTEKYSPKKDEGYFLYVGRLAKSKNVDLAIKACTNLSLQLKLVGSGKGLDHLKNMAGPTIEFLGAVDDSKLHQLYAGAKAFIFPAEDEDFGIVPVEAMGHGVPVVCHRSGGPKETVIEGKTGLFFDQLTVESLMTQLEKIQTIRFDKKAIRKQAEKFSKDIFKKNIQKLVG
ncbi:MAG: glycosyltransferase family 4 protein [Candidatus Pacebacteria bacterium]|nr:glycosyltransferase family 4 protein [Candidatus Paceibacterota bacterium]